MSTQKKIFISSTCHDLKDVRAELAEHLRRHAFLVSASDDYESSFALTGTTSTIDTCLQNVETCDAAICILDRRYGSRVPSPHKYQSKSVTHAEILHACANSLPLLTFVRDVSSSEAEQCAANTSFALRWIQDPELANLIGERRKATASGSNWVETFETSVDLKPLVLKRLFDLFPEQGLAFARKDGQIVRLYYTDYGGHQSQVIGHFTNAGKGSALDVAFGWSINGSDTVNMRRGAVMEGEMFPGSGYPDAGRMTIPTSLSGVSIFCSYSTPHGSRFRVEAPLVWGETEYVRDVNNWERFLIDVGGFWVAA